MVEPVNGITEGFTVEGQLLMLVAAASALLHLGPFVSIVCFNATCSSTGIVQVQ